MKMMLVETNLQSYPARLVNRPTPSPLVVNHYYDGPSDPSQPRWYFFGDIVMCITYKHNARTLDEQTSVITSLSVL
jgi:hypothetical protein